MCAPILSIIIPVYNAEKFLSRCIDSILSQSFTDYELLLIDDGSKDDSGTICDEYAAKDDRIRVFHKENGGVSSARNLGLDNAKGEWISFVDADDEILPNGFQVMADGFSDEVGMVMAGFQECENGEVLVDTSTLNIQGEIISIQKALLMQYDFHGIYMGYPWGRLYKRSIVTDNNLLFDEHIAIKEDTLFVVSYLCKCKKNVFYTSVPVYNYLIVSTGAMGSLAHSYNPKYVSSFDAVVEMNRLIQKLPMLDSELSDAAKKEVITRCYRVYGHMLTNGVKDMDTIKRLKKKAKGEVGTAFYLDYQCHRNIRRIKNFIKRKLKIK